MGVLPPWVSTLITVFTSGGFLVFIQFMINRHDVKNDRIKELNKKIEDGLKEREDMGKRRYDEHAEALEELRQAILQLTDNTKETQEMLSTSIKHNQEVAENLAELVVGLGQDRIIYLCDKYQKRGAITIKEQANLTAIYVPYHDKLGGNGYGKKGYDYCMGLPVITEEEAIELDKKLH